MPDETPTPETGAPEAETTSTPDPEATTPPSNPQPAAPAAETPTGTPPAEEAESGPPPRVPDDHPWMRAHRARKEELSDARAKLTDANLEIARLRAVIEHGLDLDDMDLLGNGSPDQIGARAKRLAERGIASQQTPRQPKPDPAQGAGQAPGAASFDLSEIPPTA